LGIRKADFKHSLAAYRFDRNSRGSFKFVDG
jgi:hypothetical protein